MTARLTIDNQLLETAFRLGRLKTHKETVALALEKFIQRQETEKLINMFHSVDFDSGY